MAIRAGGKRRVTHRPAGQVTTLTGDPAVPTPKWIAGPIVVEIDLPDLLPTGSGVTTLAVAAQTGGVRISVTVRAAIERDLGKPEKTRIALERILDRHVAGLALDLTMQPGEREARLLVSKAGHRQPLGLRVAGLTTSGLELPPVLVAMA